MTAAAATGADAARADHVRRLAWNPPQPLDDESVDAALVASGARPWQREQTVPLLVEALTDPAA